MRVTVGACHFASPNDSPLIEAMPEIGVLALSTLCLTIGVPSTLLVDPIVLSVDPFYGVIKLTLVTVVVTLLQISFFNRFEVCQRWFEKQRAQSGVALSPGSTVICLLFRTLPILPFGVATLYLCYRVRRTSRILIFTLLGSLLYYSALSWFVHASTTWFH